MRRHGLCSNIGVDSVRRWHLHRRYPRRKPTEHSPDPTPRPTANLDDLSEPGLYAIVALVLVEDHAADRCAPTPYMPASDA